MTLHVIQQIGKLWHILQNTEKLVMHDVYKSYADVSTYERYGLAFVLYGE